MLCKLDDQSFIFYTIMKELNLTNSNFTDNSNKKKTINSRKSITRKNIFFSLAEEDLAKYRSIINDPEALISIDDPLGICRSICMLCKLDCKR